MRTKLVILLVFGLVPSLMVNAQHDREHGQGGGHTAHGAAPRSAAPMHTAPMHVAPMQQPSRSVIQNVAPNQPNAQQSNSGNRQISGSTTHSHNSYSQHTGNNQQQWWHQHNQNNGTTSVIYPYYYSGYDNYYPYYNDNYNYDYDSNDNYDSAPYAYSNQTSAYPNSYFVCYQVGQSGDNLYHITCPYPVSWYSTDPTYNSYSYQSNYQPQYVCPNHDAPYYLEFISSIDATTWANNNCNRDLEEQELP